MSHETTYIGNELELFAHAKNWKQYWGNKVMPYIGGHVLEVGAGIGTNTKYLLERNKQVEQWFCVEPDQQLAAQIEPSLSSKYKSKVYIEKSYLKDFKTTQKFDSILYIDVIEHLEDDKKEIEYAKSLLSDHGHLIILVPAHNYLYSDFDKAIGHYRRYNKKMLKAVVGQDLHQEKLMYLDSVGMAASTVNKLFLKQSYPTLKQIKFWDNYIVSTSMLSDKLLFNSLGKTLIGVWKKQ
jgi:2-polyprenyl-3-methyl-5-hydroxy-6-metoxy-1,4-benzoquinol methylase